MAGASQDRTKSLGHDAQQETAATAGGGVDQRTLLHRRLMVSPTDLSDFTDYLCRRGYVVDKSPHCAAIPYNP